ncbi:DUF501 domain-containing protein [Micrococcus lylae]|uniref:DUF501 domain-containing protein n=1 Tax=Micrococcus lylae TaxID=1273 RepID=UPI0021A4F927|nr:DUF501 domain-containing protein [Micrococcus lylae]MCT2006335.1 DUF501 domain-containing protein [Micrococcus lylae]MCT2070288.1 DUF501 domain-containing protein [Micrococcus lylae]
MNTADRTVTEQDLDTLSLQLGRPVRDVVEIGARCVCGSPLVATTAPRLSNGIPFPTTFYLTHPVLTAAVSRLEADGEMTRMNERLAEDAELAAAHREAHEAYLAERDRIGRLSGVGEVKEIAGISAGGMPERVKCLHVLVGHSLAAGPGVNRLGDETLEKIAPWWTPEACRCDGAWDASAEVPTKDLSRHVKHLEKVEALKKVTVAGIDCGTNSIRLLIARPDEQDPETLVDVVREMTIVRLGEGVDATGEFSAAALERTFAAVDAYARLVQRHHAGAVRFVATSATRDVQNRQVFVDGVTQRLGVEPEVISGAEEASLSFRGAVSALPPGLDPQDRVLVVDLGGGSTEFVVGTAAGEVLDAVSTDMGCVRFTERFLPDADPTEDQVAAATAGVDEILDHVAGRLPLETVSAVVGVAGTVTTVTAHALGLEDYDSERIHATVLPVDEVTASARALRSASREERAAMGFMHPGRVDVIGAGALIWSRIVERMREVAGVTDVVTSERDILDGIVLSMKDH